MATPNTRFALVALLPLVSAVLGCEPDKPPQTAAHAPVARAEAPRASAQPTADPRTSDVAIHHEVLALCDIPTPYFSFDAANLSPSARSALDALATCFTEGNGRGHGLKFVGHADPRGLTDYNFALGQRRAGAVSEYVVARGLDAERVESSSRGELDARGSDEAGWEADRKVEILLADD
jgi:peptidoglycan-associated lipoprotein